MNKHAAHTAPWETFEVVFGVPLLLSLVLGFLIPLPLTVLLPRVVSIPCGIILLLVGIWVVAATRRQFNQASQPTDPGLPTTQLITNGVFSWSRNPLYLAGGFFILGLALLLNSVWLMMFLAPAFVAAHIILIFPEEKYLEARFGETYRQYKQSVRRWIGRRNLE